MSSTFRHLLLVALYTGCSENMALNVIENKCSDMSIKVWLPALLGYYDRPTVGQTDTDFSNRYLLPQERKSVQIKGSGNILLPPCTLRISWA